MSAKRSRVPSHIELDKRHLWHPFTEMGRWLAEEQVVIVGGKGSRIFDESGRSYLDANSSMWVNILGHRNPRLDRALRNQIRSISHSTMLGLSNVPAVQLAERLAGLFRPPLTKVFYSDDGSTAVEVALKLAFHYWQLAEGPATKKKGFISYDNGYHGDTVGAVSVGGIDAFHAVYRPILFDSIKLPYPYCQRCPYGRTSDRCAHECIEEMQRTVARHAADSAALVIEPLIQAATGFHTAFPGYLAKLEEACRRHDVLLVVDEVATGFGRTGKLFAIDHEGVTPDLVAVSKGISGGYLPFAATIVNEKIFDAFNEQGAVFFHGHSYTGNQLGAALALEVIDELTTGTLMDRLPRKIRTIERRLAGLGKYPWFARARQVGMMAAVDIVRDAGEGGSFDPALRVGPQVVREMLDHGVSTRNLGDSITVIPPLTISPGDLATIFDVLEQSVETVVRRLT